LHLKWFLRSFQNRLEPQ